MKKTLRNIVLFPIIIGSLSLLGCGIKDIAKNATEEIIGEENVYEKALDIHKNPAEYAKSITENVLQEKETEREIDWYFLQGKELEGIILASKDSIAKALGISTGRIREGFENPDIADKREIAEKRGYGWDNLLESGEVYYIIPSDKEETKEAILRLSVDRFESEIVAWEMVKRYEINNEDLNTLMFIQGDTIIIFDADNTWGFGLEIKNQRQALSYINSISHYRKRTNIKIVSNEDNEINDEAFSRYLEEVKNRISNPSKYYNPNYSPEKVIEKFF
jgi:hypothetical protein